MLFQLVGLVCHGVPDDSCQTPQMSWLNPLSVAETVLLPLKNRSTAPALKSWKVATHSLIALFFQIKDNSSFWLDIFTAEGCT